MKLRSFSLEMRLESIKNDILFQLNIVWQLFLYHCNNLNEREAMWCKTEHGLQIRNADNKWTVDWLESEAFIESLDEKELQSGELCRWPFEGQSMCSLALWLNAEFMKNVAEIGAARFLYAVDEE